MESHKSPIYNKVCVNGRFCNVSESLSYLVDQRYSGKKSKRPANMCHMPVFGDKRQKPHQIAGCMQTSKYKSNVLSCLPLLKAA